MLKFFNKYYSIRNLVFFILESLLVFFSIYIAIHLFYDGYISHENRLNIWIRIGLITFILQIVLYYCSLYEFRRNIKLIDLILKIVQAVGITCIILSAIYFIYPPIILNQGIFLGGIFILLFFLVSWRIIYIYLSQSGFWNDNIIIVMDGSLGKYIIDEIKSNLDSGYTIQYIFLSPGSRLSIEDLSDMGFEKHHIFKNLNKLCELAVKEKIKKIIVALEEKRGNSPIGALLECRTKGIDIIDGITFYENLCGKVLVTEAAPSWLVFSDGFSRYKIKLATKRLLDIILATIGLILLSPIFLVISILVKATSKGPIFFIQERTGQWERPYRMFKFRTMKEDSEKNGAQWAQVGDSRITGLGSILRRFRQDEIPQFWNVLKGDMSFVGPRPEIPQFVNNLKQKIPYYSERHSLKPGITGWAQVNYPYGASEKDALKKLEYDLFYVKNMTILFDLYIILKTVKTVFTGQGAR